VAGSQVDIAGALNAYSLRDSACRLHVAWQLPLGHSHTYNMSHLSRWIPVVSFGRDADLLALFSQALAAQEAGRRLLAQGDPCVPESSAAEAPVPSSAPRPPYCSGARYQFGRGLCAAGRRARRKRRISTHGAQPYWCLYEHQENDVDGASSHASCMKRDRCLTASSNAQSALQHSGTGTQASC